MTNKPENPPAFPQAEQLSQIIDQGRHRIQTPFIPANPGMSLRDYFAAQIISGILSSLEVMKYIEDGKQSPAGTAYAMANAMLTERSKNEPAS
jgi:hypothetical protein